MEFFDDAISVILGTRNIDQRSSRQYSEVMFIDGDDDDNDDEFENSNIAEK